MKCPICIDADLVMSERQGIEIDYCPKCRGVWLDRGELDKIIDRSAAGLPAQGAAPAAPVAPPPYPAQAQQQNAGDPRQQHSQGYPQQHAPYKKKKREGFLSDLFDFD
ncbi:zf-TFIIB domain-containing protein [Janthinobacterium sp. 17J80-10]|uniref:TFIIB-type zinc ribbon-containing protein n=1 Tax=Janthinobacterium sp. 17J80-10 TaxID=2497863 RepID=UPI001005A781|nr:zf-TFIIB domain-containing protein [Janthinobacterium sp. 17J80-10]QAU33306.1 hypothetical protein EKL02_03425 [Janthinobacterium sp. 17J80-10]